MSKKQWPWTRELKLWKLQYSSQIVETDPVSCEFSRDFDSYIHSSHFCCHLDVPLSFPDVAPRVFWSTETIDRNTLNNIREGETHTSVSSFLTSIVAYSLFWLVV